MSVNMSMCDCVSVHVCDGHSFWPTFMRGISCGGQFGLEMHTLTVHTTGFETQLCHSV